MICDPPANPGIPRRDKDRNPKGGVYGVPAIPSNDSSEKRWWHDAALWTVGLTALVFTTGFLYLGSRYGKLGVPETALDFSPQFVMESSIAPLVIPGFWLSMAAMACAAVSRKMVRPARASPFFPLSTTGALALVLGWIAGFELYCLVAGPAPPFWAAYSRRAILASVFGIGLFGLVLWRAVKAHRSSPPPKIAASTTTAGITLAAGLGLATLSLVTKGTWPLNVYETSVLCFGLLYFGVVALLDWRKWQRAIADTGEWDPTPVPLAAEGPSPNQIMWGTVAMLSFLLIGGLDGAQTSSNALAGCAGWRTVEFPSAVPGVDGNHTLALVLAHDGKYWLRDLDSNMTLVLPDTTPVVIGWKGPSMTCA